MILKSITLTGFKSFAKKTTIDISKNVTGIVGPNGSGKSNIAEAVRFVMGEQSMKSIRSKSMGDLVFKGSEHISQMSRASVSIEIDNKIKTYNEGVSPELATYLSYDEITLSREVFVDGGSIYKINGGEVRLKDVQSLLALAGIGASAHTIISQGEADKILMSSSKDRKEMIEDALGLKIHQIRLKDSERKLKKVNEHVRTAELLRREIAPELSHLKVQMEKINKIEGEREKLLACYLNYFAYENAEIDNLKNKINNNKSDDELINTKKSELDSLRTKERELNSLNPSDNTNASKNIKSESIISLEKEISEYVESRFELERNLSVYMYEKKNLLTQIEKEIESVTFTKSEFLSFKNNLKQEIEKIENIILDLNKSLNNNYNSDTNSNAHSNLSNLENIKSVNSGIKNILSFGEGLLKENNNSKIRLNIENVDKNIQDISNHILEIKNKIEILNSKIKEELAEIEKEKAEKERLKLESVKNIYSDIYKIEKEINNLESEKQNVILDMQALKTRESDFTFKLEEGTKFVGPQILNYKMYNVGENIDDKIEQNKNNYNHSDGQRMIERLKIRIEEIGILDPTSVKNSFEEISGRDIHLSTEVQDLKNTQKSLDEIIVELENNIKNDFNRGIEKINFAFNNLFHEVFPGGRASIKVEKILNKNDKDYTGDIQDEENSFGDIEVAEGINLSINLPSKKVSDINMLSGGEKTLASIALLFALTSITPPPFMVLDETDAALDEMNARKYGKLLSKLAEKSRLLVITHNRETMNECDILYGVTVGGDGSSKILSIKFD